MSWQEELRKLDEELAAGQISADDYRVRRDQVLSSAVASGPGQPQAQEATQFIPQLTPPPPQPPQMQQPPQIPQPQQMPQRPPQPQPRGGEDNEADQTQIVPGDADRTQAVGGWHAARPGEVDRTQVVPGVPPQTYAGGLPPRPAPGLGQYPPPGYPPPGWQGDDLAPPWAGADFPPLAASGSPDWVRQGPELFESGGRSNTARVLLIVLVVVVVLGVGAGAYFFFTRDKGTPTTQPTTATSTTRAPTTSVRPKDNLEVADLPGTHEQTSAVTAFTDAAKANFLTPDEIKAYQQAGATKCRLAVTLLPDQSHAYIFTTQATDAAKATVARDGLAQLELNYGLKTVIGSPKGVVAAEVDKADNHPATIRAHYTHGSTIVRIQVYGDSLTKVRDAYDQVLNEQLKALAVDG